MPDAASRPSLRPRLGAVSFLHRFGSALDRHVHLHACVTDGLFMPGHDGGPERIRYSLPRHKRGQWVGAGRKRRATGPGQHGVVDLAPGEFLDRVADLVPPPRKHRHRYHGVFAPNHPLRPADHLGRARAGPAERRSA